MSDSHGSYGSLCRLTRSLNVTDAHRTRSSWHQQPKKPYPFNDCGARPSSRARSIPRAPIEAELRPRPFFPVLSRSAGRWPVPSFLWSMHLLTWKDSLVFSLLSSLFRWSLLVVSSFRLICTDELKWEAFAVCAVGPFCWSDRWMLLVVGI